MVIVFDIASANFFSDTPIPRADGQSVLPREGITMQKKGAESSTVTQFNPFSHINPFATKAMEPEFQTEEPRIYAEDISSPSTAKLIQTIREFIEKNPILKCRPEDLPLTVYIGKEAFKAKSALTSYNQKLPVAYRNFMASYLQYVKNDFEDKDHYFVGDNSVNLFCNNPLFSYLKTDTTFVALHELGHAVDLNSRKNLFLYNTLGHLPYPLGSMKILFQEFQANKIVHEYLKKHNPKQIPDAWENLLPFFSTYFSLITSASSILFYRELGQIYQKFDRNASFDTKVELLIKAFTMYVVSEGINHCLTLPKAANKLWKTTKKNLFDKNSLLFGMGSTALYYALYRGVYGKFPDLTYDKMLVNHMIINLGKFGIAAGIDQLQGLGYLGLGSFLGKHIASTLRRS